MPCKQHKQALTEVANSGTPLSSTLRAHLEGCHQCRTAYAGERALFAAIDNCLRRRASAEVPASFLPAVCSSLDESAPRNSHRWVLALAAALLVIVAGGLSMTPLREPDTAGQTVKVKPGPDLPSPAGSVLQESPSVSIAAHPAKRNSHKSLRQVQVDEVYTAKVLVPSEEREAFQRFVAERQEDEPIVLAFVSGATGESFGWQRDNVVYVAPLEVKRLEVRALDPQAENSEHSGNSR